MDEAVGTSVTFISAEGEEALTTAISVSPMRCTVPGVVGKHEQENFWFLPPSDTLSTDTVPFEMDNFSSFSSANCEKGVTIKRSTKSSYRGQLFPI